MPVPTPKLLACSSQVPNRDAGEFLLLSHQDQEGSLESHDLSTAPLVTRGAINYSGYRGDISQYGLMGSLRAICDKSFVQTPGDPRLYLNTNAPFSALVCGVQGSGKSHTVSTMLENFLIPGYPAIGTLQKPLAGLVLHFGEGGLPCEAAWVGVPQQDLNNAEMNTPTVRVFVSSSSLNTMKDIYAPLGSHVTVEPLLFSEEELDAEAFLSMMAVGSSNGAPLYMQAVLAILRELGEKYTYRAFSQELEIRKSKFNPAQLSGLEQRLSLLSSFTRKSPTGLKAPGDRNSASRFAEGQLSIIDLSDPFIDAASACGLFEIVTRLFVRSKLGTGKVLLVDEAHKYLSSSSASSGLTQALLSLIRQQRHLSMRVIISTQEPTVVPSVIIDLCSIVFLHRFSSPCWWEHVIKHVSADVAASDAFDKVVKLKTGEAIVLAPAALEAISDKNGSDALLQLGRRYMMVKTRKRVTQDGGASILVLA